MVIIVTPMQDYDPEYEVGGYDDGGDDGDLCRSMTLHMR